MKQAIHFDRNSMIAQLGLVLFLAICLPSTKAEDAVIRHAFLAADPHLGTVAMIDETGAVTWEFKARTPCDATLLPDGHVLVSNQHGAQEIDREKKVLWEYHSAPTTEIYSCQKLPDGKVLLCEGGAKRLVEVDRDGHIAAEIPLVTEQGVHGQFRIARKLPNGVYLVAFWKDGCVKEIDSKGTVLRTIGGLKEAYMAQRLPNGNTLVGCGDAHRVVEIDPEGKEVWQVTENELPGHPLRFVAHVERLANGNTIICNWPCHGFIGKQPQMVEVTPEKRVVWQFDGRDRFKGIIGIQLLDGSAVRLP